MMPVATGLSPDMIASTTGAAGMAPAADSAAFQNSVTQVAAADGARSQAAPGAFATSPVNSASEVSRTTGRTASLGERILENLANVHQGNSAQASASPMQVSAPSATEKPLLQAGASNGAAARPHKPAPDNFDAMIETLQSVYNNVIQVSLVSKSTGSFSSSLNKLMSAS
ncbi:nodulation protein NolB [Terrihabitans sp. B22-R8]|uniref:nodulation protein NolB n=1 Tax=Terrihabitans sp. B22-R8 TaxID=3425128 RepID=UPI00403D3768